jgi:NAD(P)H-dependent FMN reductase
MHTLNIINGSTRPGSRGKTIALWIEARARRIFNVEVLDLAVIDLPFLDEPHHPRLRKYQHEHTRRWSTTIASGDAFILVTPEYNHGYPAPVKNAIDYLYHEWAYKPVAFVSYGGLAAGTRSVQMLKQVVTSLRMVPLVEAVSIPFFSRYFDENGRFNPDETLEKSAQTMLAELERWTTALHAMRQGLG